MRSSFKIIKNNRVNTMGEKEIITKEIEIFSDESFEETGLSSKNPEIILEYQKHKVKADKMLKNAKNKAEEILRIAKNREKDILKIADEKAKEISEEARKEGYGEGTKKGYEDGYALGMDEARIEKEKLILEEKKRIEETEKELNNILFSAKEKYEEYLEEKAKDIKNLIFNITEKIIKKEFSDSEVIENIISETIKESKSSKTIIIKCSENHADFIKAHVDELKNHLTFDTSIFVITDTFIKEGNVLIEKADGKIEFGYDTAIKKLKEILTN